VFIVQVFTLIECYQRLGIGVEVLDTAYQLTAFSLSLRSQGWIRLFVRSSDTCLARLVTTCINSQ